jgi:hypothetical protein
MPQARSGGSRSTSGAKATSGGGQGKRSAGGSSARSASSARSTRAKPKVSVSSAEAELEAAAQRLRKLNERIIEAGKKAGETTLASYEKALKAIAGTLERGPGSSDIDWISNLATTQAKFIRDVTAAWTSAARDRLK